MATGEQKTLLEGIGARMTSTGHMVFARGDSLWAVPFDTNRLELTGEPAPVLEGVQTNNQGVGRFAIGGDGSLAYVPGLRAQRSLIWVDRNGREEPLMARLAAYESPRISPDGRHIALTIRGTNIARSDIWVYDLERGSLSRLTSEGENESPLWTSDGQQVIFAATRGGGRFRGGERLTLKRRADGSGEDEVVQAGQPGHHHFGAVSADGRTLAFTDIESNNADIWLATVGDAAAAHPFLQTEDNEQAPTFAPDGRRLVYVSNETGRREVYVQLFESPDIKVGRSQRTGTTCAVSPAHLSSSNNYRLNTLRRLLAAAEQAPQPERGLRRRPSTEARKYCSGRSQKNP